MWNLKARADFSVLAESQHLSTLSASVVMAWLCTNICAGIVIALITAPLNQFVQAASDPRDQIRRREFLEQLSERKDEFSVTGTSLLNRIHDYQEKLKQVSGQETETRAAWSRLNTVLQTMSEGVIAIDSNERIEFANLAVHAMLDISEGQTDGRLIYESVRNTHIHDAVRETLAESRKTQIEFTVAQTEHKLSLAVSPLASGGAVLVLADITDVRRLEAMRRDFVSAVSHELKTPLTVIQACTETLLDGAIEDTEAAPRFLRQIEEQSDRLLQLIIGMMQLARLESGEHLFHKEAVDLRELVDNVVRLMNTVAQTKRIALEVTGCDELFVLSDRQATRTIIDNLIDNALKYTPENGKVTVELTTEADRNTLRVIDSGNGISEDDQARVFERFFRVERDRNSESGGTGMGLAIVKHLCQAMGADVSLHSRLGDGTTITVEFPFQD